MSPTVGRWVLIGTILASSMAFIDSSALNVALPALQSDLNASAAQLLWVVNSYLLMLASLILIGGSLGDRLGRKRVFVSGIVLFTAASILCGLAPTANWLIAARLLQGIGGALMIPGSLALIAATFNPDSRGRAIGTWSAVTTLVVIAGPVLGGVLADVGFWRGVFLINVPLAAVALYILSLVPENRTARIDGRLDYVGAALAALGLGSLTYGLISAPEFGFDDWRIYGTLTLGVLALAAFVVVEARGHFAMMPLHVFRSRTFSGANLLTLFLYGALNAAMLFLALNLVQVQGYSQTLAGFAFTPFALLLALLSRSAGSFADRHGPRLPLIVGPALVGVGLLAMGLVSITGGPTDYWRTFFPRLVILGIGMGITVAPLTTAVMTALSTDYSGTASGINNAVARTAGVLAIAVLGTVVLFTFANGLEANTAHLQLSSDAREALQMQASRLGDAEAPNQVDGNTRSEIETIIRFAFVDAFRWVMFICAAMAWMAALMAAFLIHGKRSSEDH